MKGLLNSFRWATHGIWHCVRHERNFRIHLVVMAYVAAISALVGIPRVELAALFCTFALVLFAEMINTSVEALVDMKSKRIQPLAGIAKDVAAGAVLVCAILSVAVGAVLFLERGVLDSLYSLFFRDPPFLTVFAVSLPLAYVFVKFGGKK